MNCVFISYRHEDPEHARSVRRLGSLLREAGIPVELDQFYLDEHPGGPDQGGWPKWCEDRANRAACVLIVASDGWFSAYEKTARAGEGLGAASEADLFRQELWDEQGNNARIRLVFLSTGGHGVVPARLRAWQAFRPFDSDRELDQLVAWLDQRLGLGGVQSPTVRWPDPLPGYQPDLANRQLREWPAIQHMLTGKSPHRILLVEAESGYGKTELLLQAIKCASRLGISVSHLDFRASYSDISAVLGRLAVDLGELLPNFARENGEKTHLLIKDLRALRRPVLLVLDTFEKASPDFQDWVCQNLLSEVERALAVAVILAGQPPIPRAEDVRWRSVACHLELGPIDDKALWEPWVYRRYPEIRAMDVDLRTLVLASRGVPRLFEDLCRSIAARSGSATP